MGIAQDVLQLCVSESMQQAAIPKGKAKGKAKPKAKGKAKSQAKGKAKAKAKGKPKAKGKAKAKGGRKARTVLKSAPPPLEDMEEEEIDDDEEVEPERMVLKRPAAKAKKTEPETSSRTRRPPISEQVEVDEPPEKVLKAGEPAEKEAVVAMSPPARRFLRSDTLNLESQASEL